MPQAISVSVAKVLVVNEKHEVLILTLGENEERSDRSYSPDLPGGMVDPGETELTAVARELYEEAGIDADIESFDLVYAKTEFYSKERKSISKFLFLLIVPNTPEVTISREHSEYKWVSADELISSVIFRPFYKEAIIYCLKHKLL